MVRAYALHHLGQVFAFLHSANFFDLSPSFVFQISAHLLGQHLPYHLYKLPPCAKLFLKDFFFL